SHATVSAGNAARSPGSACCHVCQSVKVRTRSVAEISGGVRPGEGGGLLADVRGAVDPAVVLAQRRRRHALGLLVRLVRDALEARTENQAERTAPEAGHLLGHGAGDFLLERVHLGHLYGRGVLDDGAAAGGRIAEMGYLEAPRGELAGGGPGEPRDAGPVEHLELHLSRL